MLKAVIFDDEYIVLQGLRQMIDWRRYGVELAGTAEDGLSALRLMRACKPDIVLTDIRMPGMDGLRLIETAAAESPETMFIVFSGFNEFEYVRRAIGLGVIDYLEKPVTVSKIEAALRKTVNRIGKEQAFGEMKKKLEASRSDLLEKATLDLLLAGERAEGKWKDVYGEDWAKVAGVTVLAFSGDRPALPEHPSYRIIDVTNGNERLAVALHRELPPEALQDALIEASGSVQSAFGSGRTYASLGGASRSYREALRALRYGQFLEESGWTRIEDVEGREEQLPPGLTRHEEAAIVSLRTGDRDGLSRALDEFAAWTVEQKLPPERVEQELLKLAYLGLEIAKETGGDLRELGTVDHRELHEMHARDEMFRWLRDKLEAALSWTAGARRACRHAAVEKALRYLDERYGQDVSLQELAEHVGLNPAYFSLLFKEQMGISYIKHLTGLRMERAKALLRSGMRVNEVSERVGYQNYRHFTELFKKTVGTTPGQYRDAHRTGK